MLTLLPSILAISIAVTAQQPAQFREFASASELAAWHRLEECGLFQKFVTLSRPPRLPSVFEFAVLAHAATKRLTKVVARAEQLLAQHSGPSDDVELHAFLASWRAWRDRLGDLRVLTVSLRTELSAMKVDVEGLLASQNAIIRRFLAIGSLLNGPFSDVPQTHWAFPAIEELRKAGMVVGYPDGSFHGHLAATGATAPPKL